MPVNQITTNFIYLTSSNFVTISHISYWDQLNSWKYLWKFWNGPPCRNKSDPSLLLNVAVDWQSSNNEACAKKLSQILANNIDNWGRGIGLRMYVRYCRFFQHISVKYFPCRLSWGKKKSRGVTGEILWKWQMKIISCNENNN